MVRVIRKDGESVEDLCRRFKNKCNHAGIRNEIMRRREYIKPGDRRRQKHNVAVRRIKRNDKA